MFYNAVSFSVQEFFGVLLEMVIGPVLRQFPVSSGPFRSTYLRSFMLLRNVTN